MKTKKKTTLSSDVSEYDTQRRKLLGYYFKPCALEITDKEWVVLVKSIDEWKVSLPKFL